MCEREREVEGGGRERVCVHVSESAFRGQEKVLDSLEQELEGCNLVDIEYWELSPVSHWTISAVSRSVINHIDRQQHSGGFGRSGSIP